MNAHGVKLIVGMMVLLSGCATTSEEDCSFLLFSWCQYDDVRLKDSSRFLNLEAHLPPVEEGNPRHIRLRYVSNGRVSARQFIADHTLVSIQGDSIRGPATLDNEADLSCITLSYGAEFWDAGRNAAFLSYWGLSQTSLDLEVTHGSDIYSVDDTTTELYYQFGGLFAVEPGLDIGITYSLSLGTHVSGASELDFFLRYRLLNTLDVLGGFRKFEYLYQGLDDFSAVDISLKGPMLGLSYRF